MKNNNKLLPLVIQKAKSLPLRELNEFSVSEIKAIQTKMFITKYYQKPSIKLYKPNF